MRRFARLPGRVLAVSSALFLGAVGALALASPAQATDTRITADVECGPTPGSATIEWTVKNEAAQNARVTEVSRTLTGLAVDDIIGGNKSVTATETVADTEKVTLTVTLAWKVGPREATRDFDKTVDVAKLDCASKPTAAFTDNCDGTTVVKVTNPGKKPIWWVVDGKGKFKENKQVAAGGTWEVTVPATDAAHVKVGPITGQKAYEHEWTAPENCFEVSHKSSCDELSITVKNTGIEKLTATIKFGDKEETTEIEPGKDDTATIEGVKGLVVTLTINKTVSEIKWTEPADCAGPTLPVTGVNAGLLAGAALVLVAGGGGLFFLARRRRIRFAA